MHIERRRPRGRSLRGVRVLPAPLSPPRPTPAWKCISSINRQSSTCPERQRWRPSIIPAVTELPVLRTQLKRRAAPQDFSRLRIHVAGRRVVAVKIGYQKLFRFGPISKWKADQAESSLTDRSAAPHAAAFNGVALGDTLGFCYAFVNGRAAGSLILREIPIWRTGSLRISNPVRPIEHSAPRTRFKFRTPRWHRNVTPPLANADRNDEQGWGTFHTGLRETCA